MKKICGVLGVIMLVLGIIAAFILAKELGVEVNVRSYSVDVERAWGKTILIFLGVALGTTSFSCILLGISEILEYLQGHIYRSSAVGQEAQSNQWKCRRCGRVNANYVGTCACGRNRTDQ